MMLLKCREFNEESQFVLEKINTVQASLEVGKDMGDANVDSLFRHFMVSNNNFILLR